MRKASKRFGQILYFGHIAVLVLSFAHQLMNHYLSEKIARLHLEPVIDEKLIETLYRFRNLLHSYNLTLFAFVLLILSPAICLFFSRVHEIRLDTRPFWMVLLAYLPWLLSWALFLLLFLLQDPALFSLRSPYEPFAPLPTPTTVP